MVTRKLKADDRRFLKRLGEEIRHLILEEKGYKSLDAFYLEFHDLIAKPTLYQICDGQRDMKLSTLRSLAKALDISLPDLLEFE
jgi:hypothetical protein